MSTRTPNRYELCRHDITQGLIAEIRRVELKPATERSGHGGAGYEPGWITGLQMRRLTPHVKGHIGHAIDQLLNGRLSGMEVSQVMVNRLEAGASLDIHRDALSYDYRFHLPVITNPDVFWWDAICMQHLNFLAGFWYGPVPFSGVLHSVTNRGRVPRYHLIVDLAPPQ